MKKMKFIDACHFLARRGNIVEPLETYHKIFGRTYKIKLRNLTYLHTSQEGVITHAEIIKAEEDRKFFHDGGLFM